MTSFKPVLFITGITLGVLAASMSIPLLVDLQTLNEDWKVFAVCMTFTAFFSGILILSNKMTNLELSTKQIFFTTGFSWLLIILFASLPFKFSILNLSTEDAFFEAMSGFTTTGATVIQNLDLAPPGILIWRAILQWLGGIAILVMAMSVLPYLRVGGMQIFQSENTHAERLRPRLIKQITGIILVYLALSLVCALAYSLAGLNRFDAVAHAMTTISTGGFSTHNNSFLTIQNRSAEIIAIIFMIIGGMPFIMFLKAVKGQAIGIFKDSQTRTYLIIIALAALVLGSWLNAYQEPAAGNAMRIGLFSVVSMMTGTGFANDDFASWNHPGGSFGFCLLLFLMVVGGCAGSTTCGIKIFRFQILYAVAQAQIAKLLSPSGVIIPRYQGKPVLDDAIISIMGFFFTFAVVFVVGVLALSLMNIDMITSISAVIACLANAGPGFGEIIGPTGTYEPLPIGAKWVLSLCMLLGRLEFFTVLVMLSPHFWRS